MNIAGKTVTVELDVQIPHLTMGGDTYVTYHTIVAEAKRREPSLRRRTEWDVEVRGKHQPMPRLDVLDRMQLEHAVSAHLRAFSKFTDASFSYAE